MNYFYIKLLPILIHCVYSHSWIQCTDYKINNVQDTYYYDDSKCFGYPRGAKTQHKAGFGVDTGFDFRDGVRCQSLNMNSYDSTTVRAKYTPGQKVCLAYPAKNHVADVCTNPFIPDEGVVIKRSHIQNSDNFNDVEFYEHLNGVHVKGEIDYKGFQNCPKFCENMDKSLCTMCFNLEDDIEPGVYTFKWTWEFNKGEFYYTCWDAEIVSAVPPMPVPPVPVPSVSVPSEPPICPTHLIPCPGINGLFAVSIEICPPVTETPFPTECPDLQMK